MKLFYEEDQPFQGVLTRLKLVW